MPSKNYRCTNLAGCDKALSKEVIQIPAGGDPEDLVCKECGKPLEAVPEKKGLGKGPLLAVVAVVAIAAGAAVWAVWALWPKSQSPYPDEPKTATAPADSSKPDLRGTPATPPTAPDPASPCGLKPLAEPDVNRLLTYLKQGMNYASQSRYALALKEFEQVRQIDPNFLAMHQNIAAAQLKLGHFSEAEGQLQEELKLIGCLDQAKDAELSKFAYMLETSKNGAGDPEVARAQTMRERLKQADGVAHYNLACIRARQGAAEQALAELRQAVAKGFSDLSALRRDPDLAVVRSAPGFKEIVTAASSKAATSPK